MGRNTSEIWKEDSTTVNTITHTYNIESQPLSSSDVASGLVYTYDGLGRMATASNAGTTGVPEVVLTLTHNRLNERTDLGAQIGSTPDFANSYLHDKLGRISRIMQTSQTGGNAVADKRADFTFGSLGYNIGISRHENLSTSNLVVSTSLSYDPFARLVGQEHVKESTPLGSYSVTYDANRRIDSMTTPEGLGEFDYDGSGQLLEADYDYQADEDFSYDLTGNRTMTGYTTGPNNQLLTAGDHEFEYDGEGNRIKQTDTATDDYVEYTWDHRNRLTKVTFFDDSDTKTKEILYTYDTHNRRIRRQLDANGNGIIDSAQNIVYDADWKPGLEDIVLIFDESDDLQHRFLHGPGIDQPLADEQPTKLHWLLPSQLGTITDVAEYNPGTDTSTNINHLTYTSFGQIASQTNSANEPYYTYTAREWDDDAELYYYRARWYDPGVGRFVSEDPIGFEGNDENLFRYVENNPRMLDDPTGEAIAEMPVAVTAATECAKKVSAAGPLGKAVGVGIACGVCLSYVTDPIVGPAYKHCFDWWYDNPTLTDCSPRAKKDKWACSTKAREWSVGTPCYGRIFSGTGSSEAEAKKESERACQDAGCHRPGQGGNCGHTTCRKAP